MIGGSQCAPGCSAARIGEFGSQRPAAAAVRLDGIDVYTAGCMRGELLYSAGDAWGVSNGSSSELRNGRSGVNGSGRVVKVILLIRVCSRGGGLRFLFRREGISCSSVMRGDKFPLARPRFERESLYVGCRVPRVSKRSGWFFLGIS